MPSETENQHCQDGPSVVETPPQQTSPDSPVKKTWWHRIAEARERGRFTEDDRDKAESWITCACGEQDPRIERFDRCYEALSTIGFLAAKGAPVDPILNGLGLAFAHYVHIGSFDAATATLYKIEQRSAELLGEPHVKVSEVVK